MGIMTLQGKERHYLYLNANEDLCSKRYGYFTNHNAVDSLIHYITRTRKHEERAGDLKAWGVLGAPACCDVDTVINAFKHIQNCYRGSKIVRRMYHFVYSFDDDYERPAIKQDYGLAQMIAIEQSRHFYDLGFQVAYAVHDEYLKRIHIHFAVNSVNFKTGAMFHYGNSDTAFLNYMMNWVSASTIYANSGLVYPIISYAEKTNPKVMSVATDPILHASVFNP